MKLELLLFAGLRQRAGQPQLEIELADGASVAELLRLVAEAHPQLAAELPRCRVAVNQEFVGRERILEATPGGGPEITLIPPVSGGHDGLPADAASPDNHGRRSSLRSSALSLARVVDAVRHRGAGGIATFEGNVREHSRGKTIRFLEYEAYEAMAVREMDRIALEVEARFPGTRVALEHRIGHLEVGESAVVIAASAAHRAEAFDACRAVIEALKERVPIWKREVDDHGEAWIGQGP